RRLRSGLGRRPHRHLGGQGLRRPPGGRHRDRRGAGGGGPPPRPAGSAGGQKTRHYAQQAGVADRVTFVEQDFFKADFSGATVVTLYLTRDVNLQLRPKLLAELRPGTRIVSFNFDMGDWRPYAWIRVNADGRALPVYLWVVPPRR